MSKELLKYEAFVDSETVVQYIEALKEGFETGKLTLSSYNKQFVFEPNQFTKIEVKVKRSSGKIKLSLQFVWDEKKKSKLLKPEQLIIASTLGK